MRQVVSSGWFFLAAMILAYGVANLLQSAAAARTTVHHTFDPGLLTHEPRGTNGFGYDPLLEVEGDTRTSAELPPQEKNARSHRAKAFAALVERLGISS